MVSFAPYAASAVWYNAWLGAITSGLSDDDSIILANKKTFISGKALARTILISGKGERLMLSMAVEGGARQLRNIKDNSLIFLSDHGNWRKNHLGAIEALYGKAPFYDYIIGELKPIYQNNDLMTLSSFNSAIHKVFKKILLEKISFERLNNLSAENVVIKERGKEISLNISPEISILDPLMKIGPETLLAII